MKKSWNAEKKELWKLNTTQLAAKLQELETQLRKDEMRAHGSTGDPLIPMSVHRIVNTKESHVALKSLRHKIAAIKTIMTVKLRPIAR